MDNRGYQSRLRTQMANERTVLSYYRSAVACIGLGAFIFKFYDSMVFFILSLLTVAIGLVIAIYGTVRYRHFKSKITNRP